MNVKQSRRTNAQTRAALVAAYLKGFADDDEIQNAFYAIEYSVFNYDDSFHNSKFEREIDKLLRHFAHIALAWQAGLLSTTDIFTTCHFACSTTIAVPIEPSSAQQDCTCQCCQLSSNGRIKPTDLVT
jgi:hypothetical protein